MLKHINNYIYSAAITMLNYNEVWEVLVVLGMRLVWGWWVQWLRGREREALQVALARGS